MLYKNNKIFLMFCTLFSLIIMENSSFAKNGFFSVKDVYVDMKDNTSSLAKTFGIKTAKKTASYTILKKSMFSKDFEELKEDGLTDLEVENLIKSISIKDEKTSSTTYKAYIDMEVSKNVMASMLKKKGYKYVTQQSSRVIIVPILSEYINDLDGRIFSSNKWSSAFENWLEDQDENKEKVVPMVFPIGDLKDRKNIDAERIINISDISDFSETLDKYNAISIISTEAILLDEGLRVRIKKLDTGTEEEFIIFNEDVVENGYDNIFEYAVSLTIPKIEDIYRDEKINKKTILRSVNILFENSTLANWIKIENKLKRFKSINSYEVKAMKNDRVQVLITYSNTRNNMIKNLKRLGFNIEDLEDYLIAKLK